MNVKCAIIQSWPNWSFPDCPLCPGLLTPTKMGFKWQSPGEESSQSSSTLARAINTGVPSVKQVHCVLFSDVSAFSEAGNSHTREMTWTGLVVCKELQEHKPPCELGSRELARTDRVSTVHSSLASWLRNPQNQHPMSTDFIPWRPHSTGNWNAAQGISAGSSSSQDILRMFYGYS